MNRSLSSISLTFIIIFTILSSLGSCIIGFHSTQPTYAGESDRPVILFDQTRNPTEYPRQTNTHLTIKEGFSDLVGLLENAGFNVQTLDKGPVTQQLLRGVAVLVLPPSMNQLQSSEESTIVNYVENGGGLLILGENGDKGYSGLAQKFGVTMLPGLLCDRDYGLKSRPFSVKISNMRRHDVTLGVESFIFNWGQPLLVDNSAQPLAFTTSQSWYETDGDGEWEGEPFGSFAVVAATERGSGRVISLGSAVCLANLNPSYWEGGLKDFNTLRLIFNIFNWIGKQRLFGIDLNYTMIVDETLAKDHIVHVKAEVSKLSTPKLTITMSMWHAGGYQNRKVTSFFASTESGSPVKVTYSATGQEQFWAVECGAATKILFEYSIMMNVMRANTYQGYLGTNYGMTEAAATFLVPLSCPIANIRIGFSLPSGWSAFSPWQREGNKFTIPSFGGTMFRYSPTIELQLFLWSTYAVGAFDQFSKMIDNTNVTIVVYSGWEKSFQEEIIKTSFDLYEYTIRLFAKLAQKRCIAIWAPLTDDGRDVSACEWSTSHGMTTDQRKYFNIQNSRSQNPLQFHHRIFHIWNACEPTGLAWATPDEIWGAEGMCQYYNAKAVAEVRKLQYVPWLPSVLKWYQKEIVGTKYDLSLVEAAKYFQAGMTEYDVDNFRLMPYYKGALVSYLLDSLIQRMPGNRSLDDFMRYLYAYYGANTGTISNRNLQLHLNAITGFNFSLFFDKYIYGTEQLPLLLEKEQIAADWVRFSQTLYLATTPVLTIRPTPNSFVTGETVTITVVLQDVDGSALVNQDVIFGFDSSQTGRARTDSKGIAGITCKVDLRTGWHDIWAISRSQRYREARAAVTVVVFSATPPDITDLTSFDRIVTGIMQKYSIPSGAVAVAKDGRLVMARGYGLADVGINQLVQPDSLFRICSLSKQITSVAILKLVEEGRLDLDAKAFVMLNHIKPLPGETVDPRIWKITVRQLLQHSSGLIRDVGGESDIRKIIEAGGQVPPTPEIYVRLILGKSLDFEPGTSFSYSNIGYIVLGRIIEKVTGQRYDEYVLNNVLRKMGITRMRFCGDLLTERAEGEVRYYDYPGAPLSKSNFPNVSGRVSWPYNLYLKASDSCGAWIGSPIDLIRFVTAIDGRRSPPFLKPETVPLMISRPPELWVDRTYGYRWSGTYHYAMGWFVRPVGADADWWHTGSTLGSVTILVRTHDGLAWAALFNSRPKDIESFRYELNDALWQAVGEITKWPAYDLFDRYQTLPTISSVTSKGLATSTVSSVIWLPSEFSLQLPLLLGLALCAVAATIALLLMRTRGRKQTLISQTKTTAFPITQVLRFSLEDMKARGTRSRITALSIMLSVAFMVFLSTMASILTVMVGQTTTVQTHYYLMEIIALMVCLVGVTNTMLMSVTERFKEIGVMKCLGARDKHVVIVFLFEALILGILGGIAGALAGLGIGMIAFGLQVGWELITLVPLHEYVRHAAVGVVTAVLLSEVGSLYPAYYVARLKPMGALRHEL